VPSETREVIERRPASVVVVEVVKPPNTVVARPSVPKMAPGANAIYRTDTEYLAGSLDPSLASAIERHFEGCPDCRAFPTTYRETLRLTGELAADEIPTEVRQRVRAALQERLSRS
jgi:hypothetical protein